jgi:hypothetical protein
LIAISWRVGQFSTPDAVEHDQDDAIKGLQMSGDGLNQACDAK